ncbi:MAG: hypothetical protein ACP5VN_07095 [Acidobacteriota bacterium]
MEYPHRQVGWTVLSFLAAGVLVSLLLPRTAGGLPSDPRGRVVLLFLPLVLALGAAFATLTVQVDRDRLLLRFGLGLWRRTVPLAEVESARPLKIPWTWGYGIRLAPGGWLYRVGGRDGVGLRLRGGRRLYVGTDDPEGLLGALRLFGVRVEEGGAPPNRFP